MPTWTTQTPTLTSDEAGFTLIETVLMLFLVSLMLAIPILSIEKMVESIEIDLFFRELTSNITLMQNHTLLNGDGTNVHFKDTVDGEEYIDFTVVQKPNHPLNRRMIVDNPYYEFGAKAQQQLSFHFKKETGNISKSSTFRFRTTKGLYKVTFWLGSGRFEIEKIQGL